MFRVLPNVSAKTAPAIFNVLYVCSNDSPTGEAAAFTVTMGFSLFQPFANQRTPYICCSFRLGPLCLLIWQSNRSESSTYLLLVPAWSFVPATWVLRSNRCHALSTFRVSCPFKLILFNWRCIKISIASLCKPAEQCYNEAKVLVFSNKTAPRCHSPRHVLLTLTRRLARTVISFVLTDARGLNEFRRIDVHLTTWGRHSVNTTGSARLLYICVGLKSDFPLCHSRILSTMSVTLLIHICHT